jgi:hypothetical protein
VITEPEGLLIREGNYLRALVALLPVNAEKGRDPEATTVKAMGGRNGSGRGPTGQWRSVWV